MTALLHLAPEVLHDIFAQVEPVDLASVAKTCRFLNKFVDHDVLLWRRQYLALYDPPTSTDNEPEWQNLLQRNTSMMKLFRSSNTSIKTEEQLQNVADLADALLKDSLPEKSLNAAWLRRHFAGNEHGESNISSFLCRSALFRGARLATDHPASSPELRQLSAKLHVFSGLDLEPKCVNRELRSEDTQPVHPYARARVYDLRRYKAANYWGPFMDDGSTAVDWEKVQAIMIDLLYNVHMYAGRGSRPFSMQVAPGRRRFGHHRTLFPGMGTAPFDQPFSGLAPNSYISRPLPDPSHPIRTPPSADLDALDPYGVSGTWMRIVCFLDYSDLYNFNFDSDRAQPISPDADRDPIDTREAFRLIKLHLHVTSVEDPNEEEADHPDYKVVSFAGTSRSMLNSWDPNANSRIRGVVRMTKGGAVRWTTWSIFQGEERWRSEGVQIGGIRSARGILGNWFDKDYDPAGPAGPTAFWKVSDDVVDEPPKPHGILGQHHHGFHGLQHQGWWAANGGGEGQEGGDDSDDDDDEDGDWVDEDERVTVHEEGEEGGSAAAGGSAPVGLGGGPLTLADLGILNNGGGHVVIGGGAGGANGGGLVLPLHQVLQLLREALEGGGGAVGEGGEVTIGLEDLE